MFPTNFRFGSRPVWFHREPAILVTAGDQGKVSFHRLDIATGRLDLLRSMSETVGPSISLGLDDKTVYAATRDGQNETSNIVRFDLSTGGQTQIYTAPDGGQVTGLKLSPDGRELALAIYTRNEEKFYQQLAVIASDGSGFRRLAGPSDAGSFVPVLGLAWSPDSRHVYFIRRKQPESELWRIPVDGGTAEYTGVSAVQMEHLDLSPDGSRVAFNAGQCANRELWVLENVLPTLRSSR